MSYPHQPHHPQPPHPYPGHYPYQQPWQGGYPMPPPKKPANVGKIIAIALIVGFICFVGFIATVIGSVFFGIKQSDAYQLSLAHATTHPAVVADIGLPIEAGFFPVGNISTTGGRGDAEFTLTLSGPKGEGRAYVQSERRGGRWHLTASSWEFAGRETNLLQPAPATEQADWL